VNITARARFTRDVSFEQDGQALHLFGLDALRVGPDGQFEAVSAGAIGVAERGIGVQGGFDQFEGVGGGAAEVGADFVEQCVSVAAGGMGLPAVIVADQGDQGVADLGLAGELGFGQRGHADQVTAPVAVHEGFGAGGELGALHADVGAGFMGDGLGAFGEATEAFAEAWATGGVELAMDGGAVGEEGGLSAVGLVDELVDKDQMLGADVFPEGANGAGGEDGGNTEFLEGEDVGGVGDGAGGQGMAGAVAVEEGDGARGEPADEDGAAGSAEWGADAALLGVFDQAGEDIAQAGAADDADDFVVHASMPP